jgi:hypothetical protein
MIHQGLIANSLGEVEGVMLIDESGVVKQGQDPVGVAVQYCGSVGKVANCQVGAHQGYIRRQGNSNMKQKPVNRWLKCRKTANEPLFDLFSTRCWERSITTISFPFNGWLWFDPFFVWVL